MPRTMILSEMPALFHLVPIKGTKGDQNYELPSDLDLNKYSSGDSLVQTVQCELRHRSVVRSKHEHGTKLMEADHRHTLGDLR